MTNIVRPSQLNWHFQTDDNNRIEDILAPGGTRTYMARNAVDASGNITGLVGKSGVLTTSFPARNTAYLIGDSQMANGVESGAAFIYNNSKGLGEALNYSLGMPWTLTNIAVSGKTSTKILNEQVPQVLAANPRPGWVLMNGGINDVVGTDDTLTNIAAIYTALTQVGIKVVDFGITPNNFSATQAKRLNTANRNRLAAATALMNDHVYYVNSYSPLLDDSSIANAAAGNYNSSYTSDNLHPNGAGAWRVATLGVSSRLTSQFPAYRQSKATLPWDGTSGDSTNLLKNSLMLLGTGGSNGTGSSGTPPQNWGAARNNGSNIAGVISNVARGGGKGNWMRVALTNVGGGNTDTFRYTSDITTGFSVGQTVNAQCEWQYNVTGGEIVTLQLNVYAFDSGFATLYSSLCNRTDTATTATNVLHWAGTNSGIFEIPSFVIPASTAHLFFEFQMGITNGGGATVDMGTPYMAVT